MVLIPKSKEKMISIRRQGKEILKDYPNWNVNYVGSTLHAKGHIQPSVWSENYHVKIKFNPNDSTPVVKLISPKLERRNGKLPPHLLKKESLCLHYPKHKEWTKVKLISKTIMPWISLWLFYYEHWLTSGKWLGGGTKHPEKNKIIVEEPPLL